MKFEIYKGNNNDWYWHLKARNNKIVADSAEGYRTRAQCLRRIYQISDEANDAKIFELKDGKVIEL